MHDAEREDLRERIAQAIFHCGAFDLYTQNMNRQPIPYGDYAGRPFLRAADAVLALLAEESEPVINEDLLHRLVEFLGFVRRRIPAPDFAAESFPKAVLELEDVTALLRRRRAAAKAPVSAPEVTDEIVQVALDAYHDCEKYNTDAVNMRSALEAAYHAEQAKGQFMGDFHRAAAERFPAEVTDDPREAR